MEEIYVEIPSFWKHMPTKSSVTDEVKTVPGYKASKD